MALADTAKVRAVLGQAGVFATAAAKAGFAHRAWLAAEECRDLVHGTDEPVRWEGVRFDHRGTVADALTRLPSAWRPRGIRILLSDLLWVGDPLATLSHLAERAATVVVVQVLAEADVQPPEHGYLRLVDSETDEVLEVFIDEAVERRYREGMTRHQHEWHRACQQTGALMTTVIAEQVIRHWQLEDLVAAEVLKVR
jgi:hypothetical protein